MNRVHLIGYRKLFCLFIELRWQLNKFLQSVIKQKLSLVQKITRINAIADKKKMSTVCVFAMCDPPQSVVQTKQFLQLNSIFSWNPQMKEKS